jgi:uncharacterized protein YbjQ (UPF0145 family)
MQDPSPAFVPTKRTHHATTSNLSVAEAAAVRRVGLAPVGFVMGTAVMQLTSVAGGSMGPWMAGGPQWGGALRQTSARGEYAESFPCAHGFVMGAEHYGFSAENSVLAGGLFDGYRLALTRLQDEAIELGAHGVVGVELSFEHMVGAQGTATFFATGTAVVHQASAPLDSPFMTNASGQNFERLVGLGYMAAGLAVGVGVVYVQPNCLARGDLTVVGPNRQIPTAIAAARGRARRTLSDIAHKMGEGVVHTEWTDRRFARYGESWNQLAVAVGTAVRRFESEVEPVRPSAVVPLRP